jgi:hypothetical protein
MKLKKKKKSKRIRVIYLFELSFTHYYEKSKKLFYLIERKKVFYFIKYIIFVNIQDYYYISQY